MKLHSLHFLCAAILLVPSAGIGAERAIAMKDLPAPVRQSVTAQSKGATLRGLSKDVEDGKTEYEAELTVNGHGKDVTFDPAGKVIAVEEEVKLETLPPAARAAIQKAVGRGSLTRVELVQEDGKTFYEAAIRKGGKSSEFLVGADGVPVK